MLTIGGNGTWEDKCKCKNKNWFTCEKINKSLSKADPLVDQNFMSEKLRS